MSAVLLVFQYGQPRIFFAMARDGLLPQWAAKLHPQHADPVRRRRSSPASSWRSWSLIGDAGETYDLTNIGTLFAFMLVCIGVLVLRYTEPDRPRPFRCRSSGRSALLLGAPAACSSWQGLPRTAWERFGIWLVIGLAALLRLRLSGTAGCDSRSAPEASAGRRGPTPR